MQSADLGIDRLNQALSGRVIGSRILFHESLSSTMDEARRLAEAGEPEGTIVVAEEQTSARGRFGRGWVSPKGANLAYSIILRPDHGSLPQVNMAATLSVSKAIERSTGLTPSIKWPNDVRLRGRKISGILVDSALQGNAVSYAVVGIGINVNFDTSLSPEIASTATSIMLESGREADRSEVLESALACFDDLYHLVSSGESLTAKWTEGLETLGQRIRVEWLGRIVEGYAESVDDQGNLMLKTSDGSIFTAVAGEVTLQVRDRA